MSRDTDRIKSTRWYYVRVSRGERRNPSDVPLRVRVLFRYPKSNPPYTYMQDTMPLTAFREIASFVEQAAKELGGTR